MMTRVLLVMIAVIVLFWLVRRALSGRKPSQPPAQPTDSPGPDLVACAHCGVHLPRTEALARPPEAESGKVRFFCSDDHLRLGPK
jgi:uncharacterized protein